MSNLSSNQIQAALQQHRDAARDVPVYLLADGRTVIGTVVDAGNHLHYVVRNPDRSCVVVDAETVRVARWLEPLPTQEVTVSRRPR